KPMFSKLKQFKDLRDTAKELKNSLAEEIVEGSGGWGKIKIKIDGNQEMKSVEIDPEYLNPDKKEKLQNDIKDAFNDGIKKIQKVMAEKMKNSDLDLSKFGL
ncbi:MAG: YbaB/EbfC family nucleoid-associated protein, partial [bacterium]